MVRRLFLVLAAASLAVVAAGCGARGGNQPYTATGTAACLTKTGFAKITTNPVKVGFIAGFADNGGLKGTASDGNVLTIAFTANATDAVSSTRNAFRLHAPKALRPHIADIMETEQNAVLVWTVTPSSTQLADVVGCLHS